MLLDKIKYPSDLKRLTSKEMTLLASEIRDTMLDAISKNGGHLASSLGVVELTLALHYVFNTPVDKIIWDVGHQTYAHKIITGRKDDFLNIRKYGGISGFPKRKESPYDSFNVGHSSTSISLAVGEAVGRDRNNKDYKVVAVIGDGSLTGGMSFEALNHIGHIGNDVIIILNDNDRSISENVGAISMYLTNMISGNLYNRFRKISMKFVRNIPFVGKYIYKFMYKALASFKNFIIPGQLFENLGIRYFGPVDGHNIPKLTEILDRVKQINSGPKIIHVITKKGKGYKPAESDPCSFHGIGSFDIQSGECVKKNKFESYSSIAGRTLATIAQKDETVVAVTAAMKEGTGLVEFEKVAPDRLYDVGIAEQHALTFSAALASTGLKPFVSIYSTFIQRAYDQLIHDVGIMNLPVKILIDRAGIVGNDGETHHGLFDISMIRNIPNYIFLAPSNGEELRDMLYYAWKYNEGPIAIRYPKGCINVENFDVFSNEAFVPGKVKVLSEGKDLAIFAMGDMVKIAMDAREILSKIKIKTAVINLQSIKPLDIAGIEKMIKKSEYFMTLENGMINGGVGEYLYSQIDKNLTGKKILTGGFPDEFIKHGKVDELFRDNQIDAPSLAKNAENYIKKHRLKKNR